MRVDPRILATAAFLAGSSDASAEKGNVRALAPKTAEEICDKKLGINNFLHKKLGIKKLGHNNKNPWVRVCTAMETCARNLETCEEGACQNETETCHDNLEACQNETRLCHDNMGACQNETQTCHDNLGACQNETEECEESNTNLNEYIELWEEKALQEYNCPPNEPPQEPPEVLEFDSSGADFIIRGSGFDSDKSNAAVSLEDDSNTTGFVAIPVIEGAEENALHGHFEPLPNDPSPPPLNSLRVSFGPGIMTSNHSHTVNGCISASVLLSPGQVAFPGPVTGPPFTAASCSQAGSGNKVLKCKFDGATCVNNKKLKMDISLTKPGGATVNCKHQVTTASAFPFPQLIPNAPCAKEVAKGVQNFCSGMTASYTEETAGGPIGSGKKIPVVTVSRQSNQGISTAASGTITSDKP